MNKLIAALSIATALAFAAPTLYTTSADAATTATTMAKKKHHHIAQCKVSKTHKCPAVKKTAAKKKSSS